MASTNVLKLGLTPYNRSLNGLILYNVFNLADSLTTGVGLWLGATEVNPYMKLGGLIPFMVFKSVVGWLLSRWCLYRLRNSPWKAAAYFLALDVFMGSVFIWNIGVVLNHAYLLG